MTQHIDPRETARNNLLALALQHCTKTAANIVPIPGRRQIIAIGTRAEVERLLELAPSATVASQPHAVPLDLIELVRYQLQQGAMWINHAGKYVEYADVERLLAAPIGRQAQGEPEGWRGFIEQCALMSGAMVNGNRLATHAKELLNRGKRAVLSTQAAGTQHDDSEGGHVD
jgi:hypothetical protein